MVARGPHLEAIRAYGLTVETPDATVNVRVAANDERPSWGRRMR